ncbi:LysR family transcriptional regulator [Gorillibacterium massiliense]|uniref:LysR family transcriptional regulator n=1 Tax=Gorillibacterium massiliense TaxID=1280390 RepID=UPI0004AE8FCC|nr:LysR family transcriptional regulator [Gorillibacterium massiliense]
MDLLQLTYFQKVARLEHMTKAARELNVAQPALSMAIARLESDLGVPLFDRHGRQIRLNAYGKAFLARTDTALTALEEGRRELADMTGLEHGQITLAVTTLNRISELLGAFLTRYPDVRFRVTQAPSEEKKSQLLEKGDIDFFFSYMPLQHPEINCLPLFTESILLAVPPSHPLAGLTSVRLQDVAEESFVSLKTGYSFRDITDSYCREAGFTPSIVCVGDEPAAIQGLVRAGLGIAFQPVAAAHNEAEASGLHFLEISEPACRWTLHLLWRKEHYLSKAARHFHNFAVDYYKGDQEENP